MQEPRRILTDTHGDRIRKLKNKEKVQPGCKKKRSGKPSSSSQIEEKVQNRKELRLLGRYQPKQVETEGLPAHWKLQLYNHSTIQTTTCCQAEHTRLSVQTSLILTSTLCDSRLGPPKAILEKSFLLRLLAKHLWLVPPRVCGFLWVLDWTETAIRNSCCHNMPVYIRFS